MKKIYKVTIKNKVTGKVYQENVSSDEYILKEFEKKGFRLPFSCRNGCCTECAVKIISGKLEQPEAMGVSKALKKEGYALLCVAKAIEDIVVETTYYDEVYELQFGQFFGQGNTRVAPPWEFEED
ncbi:MAG: ferredoxin [Prochlorococcus sp. SP3034]|nr:ferredoxin [Prochlorococcus sp. SP3034]